VVPSPNLLLVLSHTKASSYDRLPPAVQYAARLAAPLPVKPEPPTQVPEMEKHPVVSDMPEAKLEVAAPVRVRLPIVPVANVKLVTNRLVVEATEEKKAVVVAWEVVALRAVKFWRVVEDVLRT